MQSSHKRVGTVSASRIRQKDLKRALTIIPDKLYFMVAKCRPKDRDKSAASEGGKKHFFSIDNTMRYEPFFIDFGPLNLACLYKFCMLLNHKLQDPQLKDHQIYYFTAHDAQKIANAAVLIGCYQVLYLKKTPKEAYKAIKGIACKAAPFRDASMGVCTYKCTVQHCLSAVDRAKKDKFLDFAIFNVNEYEYFERVECGDFNVILPGKFIAFAGPSATNIDADGYPALTPDYYIPIWKKFKVSTIVRLNKKCYDKRSFTNHGFKHFDLYFTDGTTPTRQIIKAFIEICEKAENVLAIHCKAGLGRTGSLMGCYIMKHYRWTAQQTLAWLRIVRPGSVIGPQQHFLEQQQPIMWKEGEIWRKKRGIRLDSDPDPSSSATGARKPLLSLDTDFMAKTDDPQRVAISPSPSPSGKVLRTDPGQDQGGILREKKRLSPKQQTKHFFQSSRTSPTHPHSARNASPRRDPKTDPRLESPRNPMMAAPSRHKKKGKEIFDKLLRLQAERDNTDQKNDEPQDMPKSADSGKKYTDSKINNWRAKDDPLANFENG